MTNINATTGGMVATAIMTAAIALTACASLTDGDSPDGPDEDQSRMVVVQGSISGPATKGNWDAAISEPNVECGLDEVAIDDIDDDQSHRVPDDGWQQPQQPGQQRCGDDYESLLFRLTNCEREARGLPPLTCDMRLVWTARSHSLDMRDRNFFDHRSPDGTAPGDRLTNRGVKWRTSAENIAMAPTMALAHSGWMVSPGHRENILRPQVDHVGIGVVEADRGYIMTTVFAGGYH